jgi:RHS repeat-associated protein
MVLAHLDYDGFGNLPPTQSFNATTGRYGWTGREFDTETGLQYNRARYYDATTGRWTSQDPLGFDAGDSNLYRYVHNKSTITIDANGLTEADMLQFGTAYDQLSKSSKEYVDSELKDVHNLTMDGATRKRYYVQALKGKFLGYLTFWQFKSDKSKSPFIQYVEHWHWGAQNSRFNTIKDDSIVEWFPNTNGLSVVDMHILSLGSKNVQWLEMWNRFVVGPGHIKGVDLKKHQPGTPIPGVSLKDIVWDEPPVAYLEEFFWTSWAQPPNIRYGLAYDIVQVKQMHQLRKVMEEMGFSGWKDAPQ